MRNDYHLCLVTRLPLLDDVYMKRAMSANTANSCILLSHKPHGPETVHDSRNMDSSMVAFYHHFSHIKRL